MARRASVPRRVAGAALVAAAVATAALVHDGGDHARTLHIEFADAGQLITGDRVEIGGIAVGKVTGLDLTADGLADVTVRVGDRRFLPLRAGTSATISTVGLSGVTNRFVALRPGPAAGAALPDGATLPQTATHPIVDIDLVLDAITPGVRADVRSLVQHGARVTHGRVAGARATVRYASPLLSRVDEFARQLTADRPAFSGLLRSGATVAATLAEREDDLTAGIAHTATTFDAVDRARRSVTATLDAAPGALDRGSALLRATRPALAALDPTLRDAQPAAAPLADVLRQTLPAARAAVPAVVRLQAALPALASALRGVPALERAAVPALHVTTATLGRLQPVFAGLRPYGDDIVQAVVRGFGGQSAYNYDANGQFGRIALNLPASSLLTSVIGHELTALAPHTLLHQTAKCPGSADRPAPDRSNVPAPAPPDCDPKQAPG